MARNGAMARRKKTQAVILGDRPASHLRVVANAELRIRSARDSPAPGNSAQRELGPDS